MSTGVAESDIEMLQGIARKRLRINQDQYIYTVEQRIAAVQALALADIARCLGITERTDSFGDPLSIIDALEGIGRALLKS